MKHDHVMNQVLRIPAVSDNESHAIADMELCGDRYGESGFGIM